MKTLIFIFLTFFALTANAQTAEVTTTTTTINTEATTADLMISIPMIGNIKIKDCDEKLQEDLKPVTIKKVIKIDDTIYFYTDESETILAASFQEEIEIELPLQ